jgi:hypothetical protein
MTTFCQIAGYGQCQFFARMLARHYGFTDEELDFIVNYESTGWGKRTSSLTPCGRRAGTAPGGQGTLLRSVSDTVKRLQAETSAELDALLPSVLDRAFRGEL